MSGPQPFRITPMLSVGAYKSYALAAPIQTHTRPARCEEVDCPNYLNGWRTLVDTATPLGQRQARYITERAGRSYVASIEGAQLVFTFAAGQQCFAQHTVPLGREPIYIVRDGDWRGNPTGRRRVHVRAEDWVDDFRTHQDALTTEIEKG